MIQIATSGVTQFAATCSLNATISNPIYLFEFQHKLNNEYFYVIPFMEQWYTSYPPQWNYFNISVDLANPQSLTGNTTSGSTNVWLLPGEYYVKVYEQNSNSNLNPALSQGQIYKTMAKVDDYCTTEPIYTGTDNEWVIYDECVPTPGPFSPTPTPSISVTPSVTPSISPSVTPSITPSYTPSPTPSVSPYKMVIGGGFDDEVATIVPGTGTTLYIAGTFSSYNEVERRYVVKIDQNGTIDTGWAADFTQATPGQNVNSIQITDDGVYAMGNFVSYGNPGIGTIKYIVRLDADTGVRDPSFAPALNNKPKTMVKKNGKNYFTGYFTTWNSTTVNRIVETDVNGNITQTYGTGFNNQVFGMVEHPDGDYIMYGQFSNFSGITAPRIVKMDIETGVVDTAFMSNIGLGIQIGNIWDIQVHSTTGQLYISLDGAAWDGTTITPKRIIRLNSDGTYDASWGGTGGIRVGNTAFHILLDEVNDFIYYNGLVNEVYGNSRYWGRWFISTATLDTTFNGSSYGSAYYTINAPQTDPGSTGGGSIYKDAQGRIYLVGDFTLYYDNALAEFEDYSRIIRVYDDNTINTIQN